MKSIVAAAIIATAALASAAPARANDMTGAIIEGVVGLALGQMTGNQGYGMQPQPYYVQPQTRYYDGGPAYGYGRDPSVDYTAARRTYRELSRRYGQDRVDTCLESDRCSSALNRAWETGNVRAVDRVFARLR